MIEVETEETLRPPEHEIVHAHVSGVFLSDTFEKVPSQDASDEGLTITEGGVQGDRYRGPDYYVKYGARIPGAALGLLGLNRESVKDKTITPNPRAVYLISGTEVARLQHALDNVRQGQDINPTWFKVNVVIDTNDGSPIELSQLPPGTIIRFPKNEVELFIWGPNDPCTRPGKIIEAAGWNINPSQFPKMAIDHYGAVASVVKGNPDIRIFKDDQVEIIYPNEDTVFPELSAG